MFEKTKLKCKLKSHVKNIEKTEGDYICHVLHANFDGLQHKMLVKDEKDFIEVYNRTLEELSPLEKADLIDYWEKEKHGRPNKTRRNLLRRS